MVSPYLGSNIKIFNVLWLLEQTDIRRQTINREKIMKEISQKSEKIRDKSMIIPG